MIRERDVGLFSMLFTVICNIPRALKEGRIPLAYLGPHCAYWVPGGYAGRNNVWEYYFEPLVAGYSADSLGDDLVANIQNTFPNQDTVGIEFDDDIFMTNNYGEHDALRDLVLPIPYKEPPGTEIRRAASAIISEYVRPRSHLLDKAERFWNDHCDGGPVIGVQVRGTDSVSLAEGKAFRRGSLCMPVFVDVIGSLVEENEEARILVASDEERCVTLLREAFGSRVIAYDARRHTHGPTAGPGIHSAIMPAFIAADREVAAANGEDAVVEYLLLSRCDHLVHNGSGLAYCTLLTEPDLPHTYTVDAARRSKIPFQPIMPNNRFLIVSVAVEDPPLWHFLDTVLRGWEKAQRTEWKTIVASPSMIASKGAESDFGGLLQIEHGVGFTHLMDLLERRAVSPNQGLIVDRADYWNDGEVNDIDLLFPSDERDKWSFRQQDDYLSAAVRRMDGDAETEFKALSARIRRLQHDDKIPSMPISVPAEWLSRTEAWLKSQGPNLLGVYVEIKHGDRLPGRLIELVDDYLMRNPEARVVAPKIAGETVADPLRQRYGDKICIFEPELIPNAPRSGPFTQLIRDYKTALVLSRCSHLIRDESAFSNAVLLLNPDLSCTSVSMELADALRDFDKIAEIPVYDGSAGICALISWVLHGVRWAESNNYFPVAKVDGDRCPPFYDEAHGDNIWEYFFEPVSGFGYDELFMATRDGVIDKEWTTFPKENWLWRHLGEPGRIATTWGLDSPTDRKAWMDEKRNLGRRYVGKYIRPKAYIRRVVDDFVDHNFSSPIVGCHVRGTDFHYATPIPVEAYFEELDRLEREYGECKVFLATDQEQYVELFRMRYHSRLVVRDATRSSDETAPFRLPNVDGYTKGEEALIDVLLLSRCSYVIKCAAAGGEYALWFNPDVPFTDFGLDCISDTKPPEQLTSAFEKLNIGSILHYDIVLTEVQRIRGFGEIEQFEDRKFRWAQPEAALKMRLQPGDYTVHIDMDRLVGMWLGEFTAHLGDVCLARRGFSRTANGLTFVLMKEDFTDEREYWLRFKFKPIDTSSWPGDARPPVGAPIFSVTAVPLEV